MQEVILRPIIFPALHFLAPGIHVFQGTVVYPLAPCLCLFVSAQLAIIRRDKGSREEDLG